MKNKTNKFIHKLKAPLVFLGLCFVLLIILKGALGDGLEQARDLTDSGQAFESSIARGRYATVLSIVDDKRWDLSLESANFGAPDVSVAGKDSYVSIFPPGTAILISPFYSFGKLFNLGQLFASLTIALLAIFNSFMVYKLGIKMRIAPQVSLVSALLFLLASNALVYSTLVSQHHLTTFVLLLGLHIVLIKKSILKHISFWLIYGSSLLVDIPNVILLLPLVFYIFFTDILNFNITQKKIKIRFSYLLIFLLFFVIVPLIFYGYYNVQTVGDPLVFGQLLPRFSGLDRPTSIAIGFAEVLRPFDVNRLPQGLNILLFGKERGILYYSPIFLAAVFGIYRMYRASREKTYLLLSVILINLLLYSAFSDVWGGWSFGPRYLIPSFAVMSVFVGQALVEFHKRVLFIVIFALLALISIAVSVLGAVTTILIPPIHEAAGLGLDPTINVAINHLKNTPLGSFVYMQIISNYMNSIQFYFFVVVLSVLIFVGSFISSIIYLKDHDKK